jgi:mRNA-degrading endonuclease RelE of RelBE toxin-antitoxin system
MNDGKRLLILQRLVEAEFPLTKYSLVFSGVPDKIEKALRKLSAKERQRLGEILIAIKAGRLDGLDIVKLKGYEDIYRVRKGDIRVIFRRMKIGTIILAIERRSDTTYN